MSSKENINREVGPEIYMIAFGKMLAKLSATRLPGRLASRTEGDKTINISYTQPYTTPDKQVYSFIYWIPTNGFEFSANTSPQMISKFKLGRKAVARNGKYFMNAVDLEKYNQKNRPILVKLFSFLAKLTK